jgi:hypothetical protein
LLVVVVVGTTMQPRAPEVPVVVATETVIPVKLETVLSMELVGVVDLLTLDIPTEAAELVRKVLYTFVTGLHDEILEQNR